MDDFHINSTSLDKSYNYSNITSDYYNYTYYYFNYDYYGKTEFIIYVVTCTIICICFPLTLVAIYDLYSLVRNDHVAPIYIINLLISDLIQLCCMIAVVAEQSENWMIHGIITYIYGSVLVVSVGFMVCVALERYLVIAWPLWYRFRRTIKISVMVCVVVWAFPLVYFFSVHFWVDFEVSAIIFAIFLLLPFPLLIFFLGGTLKALSASISVPSDEKRRIVGILVLVLLIYTLLFLPSIMLYLAKEVRYNYTFSNVSFVFVRLSPLADLALCVFMRKGTIDKLLASVCCCRMDSNEISSSTV